MNARRGASGAVSAMVEWDDNIPEFAELARIADRARDHLRYCYAHGES